ncbi:MAG: hypothetical protein ACI4RO_01900 [Candidatus Scatosoma sp.]
MFEFKKLCNEYEKLSVAARNALIVEKSAKILTRLRLLGADDIISPVKTLACFILSSVVSDGKINEQEYILIYPALIKAFGSDFDFSSVKAAVEKNQTLKKAATDYAETLASLLAETDENFINDVIGLCLCVVSVDGKISLRERNYIKKLYKA